MTPIGADPGVKAGRNGRAVFEGTADARGFRSWDAIEIIHRKNGTIRGTGSDEYIALKGLLTE